MKCCMEIDNTYFQNYEQEWSIVLFVTFKGSNTVPK